MKTNIDDYMEKCLSKVEAHVAQLIEGAERLESMQVAAQIFLQNSHITDVVKGKKCQIRDLMKTTASIENIRIYDKQIGEKTLLPLRK